MVLPFNGLWSVPVSDSSKMAGKRKWSVRGGPAMKLLKGLPPPTAMAGGYRRKKRSKAGASNTFAPQTINNRATLQYRARRNRRGRGKFARKVLNVFQAWKQPQIAFEVTEGIANVIAGEQGWIMCHLNTVSGGSGFRDIGQIFSSMLPTGGGPTTAGTYRGNKLLFKSSIMQCSLYNGDTKDFVLDIYEFVCRRDMNEANINTAFTVAVNAWTGSTAVTVASLGVSPFDVKTFVNYFKIISKRQVLLEATTGTELVLKDNKPKIMDGETVKVDEGEGVCKRGWTKGLLVVFKTASLDGTNYTTESAALRWKMIRRYNVKIINNNAPSAGIFAD